MVDELEQYSSDPAWLLSVLPLLEREYEFWMRKGEHYVNVTDIVTGETHWLNRYYTNNTKPRPEAYVEDEFTAWILYNQSHLFDEWEIEVDVLSRKKIEEMLEDTVHPRHLAVQRELMMEAGQTSTSISTFPNFFSSRSPSRRAVPPSPVIPNHNNDSAVQLLFAELSASAESGWDFSSRWFHDRYNLTSVETMGLIPVDLNAVLYKVEIILSNFTSRLGRYNSSLYYTQAAERRMKSIHSILWNIETQSWQDFHLTLQTWKKEVMISSWIPLWTKCYNT
jgi:neutral trehalase